MKKTTRTGSFFLILLLNILLNIRLTVPGWILLILHFVLGISLWWFAGYMGAFLLYMLLWMLFLRLFDRIGASAPDPPPIENKNPYSSKGYTPIDRR